MDLTLPQAILLLTLDDKTGKTEDGYYQPALAGAALAELFLKGTIELEEDDVVPLRHTQHLGAFLQQCDAEIGGATKRHNLPHWISTLANQKDFIATLADELCHLGALSKDTTRVFGLFTRTIWPEASPVLEQSLKAEMKAAMFTETGEVDERLCLTIAFAKAVG
ncbi:MAG: GPP34 family phosphoprotein, partial [Pseudomonadota bacterium]